MPSRAGEHSTRRKRRGLADPGHVQMVRSFSEGPSSSHAKAIRRALRHLESLGKTYSELVPQGVVRPLELERIINDAIKDKALQNNSKTALIKEYGLVLLGPKGLVRVSPDLEEHVAVLDAVPSDLPATYKSCIRRLLVWMEAQTPPRKWSELAPDPAEMRPPALEATVNEAIRQGVPAGARSALNVVFNLELKGGSRQFPHRTEHAECIRALPADFHKDLKTWFIAFLCHLEENDKPSLPALRGNDLTQTRPLLLEQAVNDAIHDFGLNREVRAAVNRALDLKIQGLGRAASRR